MISRIQFENTFSLATAQALQQWADDNLIEDTAPPVDDYLDVIWNDYHSAHEYVPLASPEGYGQFDGPYMRDIGPNGFGHAPAQGFDDWHLCVPWVEQENASYVRGCNPERSDQIGTSVNTDVEYDYMYFYIKYDGVWEHRVRTQYDLAQWQKGITTRGGCIPDADNVGGDPHMRLGENGRAYYDLNTWGNWWHQWTTLSSSLMKTQNPDGTWKAPEGIAHLFWARLHIMDTELPDDRDDAVIIVHVSMDKYIKENIYDTTECEGVVDTACCPGDGPIHCCDWDTGISRYKKVTNDWQLFAHVSPNYTELNPSYEGDPNNILDVMTREEFDQIFGDLPIPPKPTD